MNMEWIAVTPDTMPPDGMIVIVSGFYEEFGEKRRWVERDVRYSTQNGWERKSPINREWVLYPDKSEIMYWAEEPRVEKYRTGCSESYIEPYGEDPCIICGKCGKPQRIYVTWETRFVEELEFDCCECGARNVISIH